MQETLVRYLGREDPLEEGVATPSGVLAWRVSMDRGAWRATVHGVSKSQTQLTVQLDYKESSRHGRGVMRCDKSLLMTPREALHKSGGGH